MGSYFYVFDPYFYVFNHFEHFYFMAFDSSIISSSWELWSFFPQSPEDVLPSALYLFFIIFFLFIYFKVYFNGYAMIVVHFFPLYSPLPWDPLPIASPPVSSCLWVIHISSLAPPFPILFLPPPVSFVPTNYASYSLYFFTPFSPLTLPLITLHVVSFSVILFLF